MVANLRFFKGSFLVTALGLAAAFWLGGPHALFLVTVLAILEISLSFDNAVVNATVLKEMDEVWQQRFLTWGILIAVFGMRIVFPLAIVSIVGQTSPWGALDIAINHEEQYKTLVESAHVSIMAFGGAFLMMVALDFFLDEEKDHWIPFVEQPIVHLGKWKYTAEVIAVMMLVLVGFLALPEEESSSFLISGVLGVVAFSLIHKLSDFMEKREEARAAEGAAKSGLAMFLYLEVLDASFSFDGVVGAFAITTDIFIIAIGLGIGAMFVRSLTIMLVKKNTLSEFAYLEHGAFYAIFALASMMFIKTFHHVPEVVTGLVGMGFIIVAFIHSVLENRNKAEMSLEEHNELETLHPKEDTTSAQ